MPLPPLGVMSGNWIDATSANLRQQLPAQELNCRSRGNRCLHPWPTIRGGSELIGQSEWRPPLVQRGCCMLLCRRSMVVLQQPTQTLPTGDAHGDWRLIASREDQHVAEPLMIPFFVIMRHELANRSSQ